MKASKNKVEREEVHIGIDDLDSPNGMCTTYLGSIITSWLGSKTWVSFIDYPYLIRLNPNIPFKTRGNGAVSLHITINTNKVGKLIEYLKHVISEYADLSHPKADPVIVVVKGPIEDNLKVIYERAVREFVPYSYVRRLVNNREISIIKVRKGRGLVGAVSSIGAFKLRSFTYELLLYRGLEDKGKHRTISKEEIIKIDRKYRPKLFANVDYEKKRILATPHGPDPVIAGFRSLSPLILSNLLIYFRKRMKFERALVYKTNQGTGVHLNFYKKISDVRPYDSVKVKGYVADNPKVIKGGHVLFYVNDETGYLRCMVYKPTGRLAKAAKLLKRGDIVEIGGGVIPSGKYGISINVELIKVVKVEPLVRVKNPICPNCNARMESAGKNKGFKCRKCGYTSIKLNKEVVMLPRILEPGIYIPSPIAYRHLSKPLETLGAKGEEVGLVSPWHIP
ncbi:MAG TPA: DUF1743 domain-containing protein [Thermofilum sp.]|nr:DUF1743 domain-containing protein [Thermofilum sp.]